MESGRAFAQIDDLSPVVTAVFGPSRRAVRLDRLPNGSKKGVYRLTLDDESTGVVYIWSATEDYWEAVLPEGLDGPADPFSHTSGLDFFEAAARRLEALDVRCPRVFLADRSRELYPADIAVVEDVRGETLESLLAADPVAAAPVLDRLAPMVDAMHGHRSPGFGKVAVVDGGGVARGTSCEQVVLDRALAEVADIAARDPRAAHGRARLEDGLHALASRVRPRSTFGLLHSELGPDHVIVDAQGCPVLIDIEGLMYFDVEWEHVFVRLRFGEHYERLRRDALDEDRLRLYQLAMHLDLVAGPLRIADTDHPRRAWFLEVAESHLRRALEFPI